MCSDADGLRSGAHRSLEVACGHAFSLEPGRGGGTADGAGTNWLGLILMEVRAELAALVPSPELPGTDAETTASP